MNKPIAVVRASQLAEFGFGGTLYFEQIRQAKLELKEGNVKAAKRRLEVVQKILKTSWDD